MWLKLEIALSFKILSINHPELKALKTFREKENGGKIKLLDIDDFMNECSRNLGFKQPLE